MFGGTIQLAVYRNRLRLTEVKSGTVVERPAVHQFSAASMLIADRERLELEFGDLVRQLPFSRIFAYPAVEVVSTETVLQPVERDALSQGIMAAGARKVVWRGER